MVQIGNNKFGNDYTYDANGNMKTDKNKGITGITYNHLNLPKKITFNTGNQWGYSNIEYVYDATGVKQRKVVTKYHGTNGRGTEIIRYAGGYVYKSTEGSTYNGTFWEGSSVDLGLQYFPHAEGYAEPAGQGNYEYVYQYKDQVNNVRLSYSDLDENGSIDPNTEILYERNYYPFGLLHSGYNNNIVGVVNNHKQYQGQEYTDDLGLNVHEWRFRFSDPAIGRFWQIDPLAEDYVHNGVYNFSENRVVDAVELEGLEAFIIHGTTQTESGHSFSRGALNQLQRIGGNTARNETFRWNAPLTNTDTGHRALAAKELAAHVATQRKEMLASGAITADEPISLVGYSHGGNVAIQAADLIAEDLGIKVNLITVSTPAYETDKNLEKSGLSGLEDPNKKSSINSHVQIVHKNDAVTSFWGQGNDTYQEGKSKHKVKNHVIKEKDVNLKGGIESHTKLPYHPDFVKFLKSIPIMDNSNK